MRKYAGQILAALYLVVAIVTFGHAASARYGTVHDEYIECMREPDKICFRDNTTPTIAGLSAAIFWPFYWSWVAFDAS